jgi:hypothetical protein
VTALALFFGPIAAWWIDGQSGLHLDGVLVAPAGLLAPLSMAGGLLLGIVVLYLARGIGVVQGAIAKHLLVESVP